ncbi:MAG: DUF3048 domain-containing protein [Candidatus Saccharimonadales bacterium]|nr:DUF3048 domain-containing protein [Candidatus Saccharimonadales bacterium]
MKLKLVPNLKWFEEHRKVWISVILGTALILVGWLIYVSVRVDDAIVRTNPSSSFNETNPAIEFEESPLTGVQVSPSAAERPVIGMMISNSTAARPQSGLHKAGVVYEAIAEGGITRYLAFFQDELPTLLGPVRSVRPYFVDWVEPFDAYFGHVGGSVQGRADAAKLGNKDVDQFSNGQYYYRSTDRFAPHNVYTTDELLAQMINDRGDTPSDFDSFPRKDDAPAKNAPARKITIDVSSALYQVSYTWDRESNNYLRSLGGSAHRDRESLTQISPKNVIAIEMTHNVVGERLSLATSGSGNAWIFRDGKVVQGKWSKSSDSAQIVFKDKNGKEIKLNTGSTWITVIPPSQSVTYKP